MAKKKGKKPKPIVKSKQKEWTPSEHPKAKTLTRFAEKLVAAGFRVLIEQGKRVARWTGTPDQFPKMTSAVVDALWADDFQYDLVCYRKGLLVTTHGYIRNSDGQTIVLKYHHSREMGEVWF